MLKLNEMNPQLENISMTSDCHVGTAASIYRVLL